MARSTPKYSTVLVTSCNGYIGSHVDQLLEAGYRVRTTRNITKIQRLAASWEKKYGAGRFEVITVEDMAVGGAFDEAVKGVSGIAHVASVLTFDPDPDEVIPTALAGVRGILKSAAREPSVKRFVYTSSSTAATAPIHNKEFHIDSNIWNEADIRAAHAPGPIKPERAWPVYGASKTEAENLVWQFVKEENPQFVVNAVLPNTNFGRLLDPKLPASTRDFPRNLFRGEKQNLPPQYYIDIQDTARLHVAGLTIPDVKNERLFAFATPFNWNNVLRIMRKLRPDHQFIDDYEDDNLRDQSSGE
ncbi:hypothetical protein G7Y89_g13647 [Cudoniella acicularis]|uniref:NAD-dependent epimerase/dehydratase domain-containing protein n=1 Tax=Cudoniella acicularis TaxID=354080 RepID=A0A8H4VY16_9HELO|nr:hypothetical protein G7Y89_g13647 [Cudoniella acicularis]